MYESVHLKVLRIFVPDDENNESSLKVVFNGKKHLKITM